MNLTSDSVSQSWTYNVSFNNFYGGHSGMNAHLNGRNHS
jgi:hypothetical protein